MAVEKDKGAVNRTADRAGDIAGREGMQSERWEEVFQGVHQPIVILDPGHVILEANCMVQEATGLSEEELRGKKCYELFHGADEPPPGCPMVAMLASGRPETSEMDVETLGRMFMVSVTPIFDDHSHLERIVHVATDITERKRLEAQLLQAQKMEAVGHLAGGLAHDFNNILTVVLGYVQMSQENLSPDDELFQNLQQIREAGEKAAVLVCQLLAFSRQQIMQLQNLKINEVVDGLLKMIRRVIGEDIDLQFRSGPQLGTVHADSGQIEQVLMNLCVNARDAMSQGGTVTIETENVQINGEYCKKHSWASEGRYVLLRVTDTGHGMSEETLKQIFEPFFSTKEAGKGTGLGLSMVYGIVKQHNGTINVYSEVGKGTTFEIYLPLVEGDAAEIGSKIEGLVRGGTETLLLAEDDELLREMTVELLEKAGYRVLVATDGQEAVDMFEAHANEISLVLLDVVMPKLSGRDACDRIREIDPDVCTLYTSGYSTDAIHTRFVLDEGVELIRKPYDMHVLLRKIREVLDSTPS